MAIGLRTVLGSRLVEANTLCERLSTSATQGEQNTICAAGKSAGAAFFEDAALTSLKSALQLVIFPFESTSVTGQALLSSGNVLIDQIGAKNRTAELIKSVTVESVGYFAPKSVKDYLKKPLAQWATATALDEVQQVIEQEDNLRIEKLDDPLVGPYGAVKVSLQATYNPFTHFVIATIRSNQTGDAFYLVRYEANKSGQPSNKKAIDILKCDGTQCVIMQ